MTGHPTTDVLIIGGGIVGTGLAYHLAMLGRSVTLLERGRLGSGASGSNQGGLRRQFYEPVNIRFASRTLTRMSTFAEETGVDPGFVPTGYVFVISKAETAIFFREAVQRQNLQGVGTTVLTPDEVRSLLPPMRTDDLCGATHSPGDGRVSPLKVVRGFAVAARRAGARIYPGTPVTGIDHKGSTVISVRAGGRTWRPGLVINAAGPWSDSVSRLYGGTLPVRAHLSSVFHLGHRPGQFTGMPLVVDVDRRVTVCGRWDGVLAGAARKPMVSEPPAGPRADAAQGRETARRAAHRFPALASRSLTRSWAGYWDVTPDDNPIVDWTHFDNLYTVAGFSGHGMCLVPGVLPVVAEELQSGHPQQELDPFRLGRFTGQSPEAVEIWGGTSLARQERVG
jgi:sarcosine oxidase, subunit beta